MALTSKDYTIGWIAALPIELAAAKAMMHKPLHQAIRQEAGDTNVYTLGTISGHNVVLTCLPRMGTNNAARAATHMLRSFPNLKCGLMVGIGGGVPGDLHDIRLGDIVVSNPAGQHGGVIQYDFGTSTQTGEGFLRKGHLNKPPSILLSALRSVESDDSAGILDLEKHYDDMVKEEPATATKYARPIRDHLFSSDCVHQGDDSYCLQCPIDALVIREPRMISKVHYGLIGSGNRVLRDAKERDGLRDQEGIMCFEMEASGLMDEFPCLVVRGISDYCDSHKSKIWQPYASIMAAAYAKELLGRIPPSDRIVDSQDREILAQCRTALNCVHPRVDKLRLEDLKGGLLKDAYKWILATQEYAAWLSDGGLLWLKGDPGKGKTMLICGIINELNEAAYFFCQNTLNTNNSGESVLAGLILALLEQAPFLAHQVHDKIQQTKEIASERAFYLLGEIFQELIAARPTTIMIDALDECVTRKEELLRFIVKTSSTNTSRWLVSSRNHLDIGEHLVEAARVSLELNESSVSMAVAKYVDYKVQQLTRSKRYDEALAAFVSQYLLEHAHGTFLWVSLVCLNLGKVRTRHTRQQLERFPSGLEDLYQHMMECIRVSDDCDLLKQILATLCVAFRPLLLEELSTYIDLESDLDTLEVVEELVSECGSFLAIRGRVVQFIHQSAKDFLTLKQSQHVIPQGEIHLHSELLRRSLKNLQSLKRNPYQLTKPGADVQKIIVPEPDPLLQFKYASIYWLEHLLAILPPEGPVHLASPETNSLVCFMETRFLFWLEALSLLRSFYPALRAMRKVEVHLKTASKDLRDGDSQECFPIDNAVALVHDGIEFMRYFHDAIDRHPLQVYFSGMIFSPNQSLVKKCYTQEAPNWASWDFGLIDTWPAIVTIPMRNPYCLRWSPDASLLGASGRSAPSFRSSVQVGDRQSGELLYHSTDADDWHFLDNHTIILINDHSPFLEVWSIDQDICLDKRFLDWSDHAIQSLSKRWAEADDFEPYAIFRDHLDKFKVNTNTKLDMETNALKGFDVMKLETAYARMMYKMFATVDYWPIRTNVSKDKSMIARGFNFWNIVLVNRIRDGTCVTTLDLGCDSGKLWCLRFNQNHTLLAVGCENGVWIWDIPKGTIISQISDVPRMYDLEFSPCSGVLAIFGIDVRLWRWRHSDSSYQIKVPARQNRSFWSPGYMTFHPLASTIFLAQDNLIEERNTNTSSLVCIYGPFPQTMDEICISENGERIAFCSSDVIGSFKVSDVVASSLVHERLKHSQVVTMLEMRHDLVYVATSSTLRILQVSINCQSLEERHRVETTLSEAKWIFSPNYDKVGVYEEEGNRIEIWDLTRSRKIRDFVTKEKNDCVCWGPGENQLTILSPSTNMLTCWDCLSEQKSFHWLGPENRLLGVDNPLWSPSGAYLLVRSGRYDNMAYSIWNSQTKSWTMLSEHRAVIVQSIFSPCEKYLAYSTTENVCRVFRLDTCERILKVRVGQRLSVVAFEGEYLRTDNAWYSMSTCRRVHESSTHLDLKPKVSKIGSWICYGSENVIWLPSACRSSCAIGMGGSKIVLGSLSDQLSMLSIDLGKMVESTFRDRMPLESDQWSSDDDSDSVQSF